MTKGFLQALTQVKDLDRWDGPERRRLVLLQYCSALGVLNMLGFVLFYSLLGGPAFLVPVLSSAACIPLYGLSWVLNRTGRPLAAKLVFFSVLSGSVFLETALVFGKGPGLHFFLLLAAVLPLLQWPLRRPGWIVLFMGGSLAGFLFVQLRADESLVLLRDFPGPWVPYFNGFSVVSVYAVTVLILALLQRRSEADAQSLEEKARQLEGLLRQFEALSNTDPLTSLNNRRSMLLRMEEEKIRMTRNHTVFAVLMGDIDFFKRINDEHGHEAGDTVLVEIGRILRSSLREVDHVARWGGEEFLVLLPDTTAEGGLVVGEKLRRQIEAGVFRWQDQDLRCTMSFGVAAHGFSSKDLLETIRRADTALYEGKRQGRNRVVLASD